MGLWSLLRVQKVPCPGTFVDREFPRGFGASARSGIPVLQDNGGFLIFFDPGDLHLPLYPDRLHVSGSGTKKSTGGARHPAAGFIFYLPFCYHSDPGGCSDTDGCRLFLRFAGVTFFLVNPETEPPSGGWPGEYFQAVAYGGPGEAALEKFGGICIFSSG